jgi:catechol 2,3-dioxygenase-like lactoylglutathione lyase family enzyme
MQVAKEGIDLGVLVHDIDAVLKFYCDDLGLLKTEERPLPDGRVMHRIAIGNTVLKLIQFQDGAPPPGPRGMTSQSGIRYFTISVRDLPGLVNELEARGYSFVMPLRPSQTGTSIAMLEDPEGNLVELLEVR